MAALIFIGTVLFFFVMWIAGDYKKERKYPDRFYKDIFEG